MRNDRIIGQAISKETPLELQTLKLKKQTISQIEFFFRSYNQLYGKKFKVVGMGGPRKAVPRSSGRAIKLACSKKS